MSSRLINNADFVSDSSAQAGVLPPFGRFTLFICRADVLPMVMDGGPGTSDAALQTGKPLLLSRASRMLTQHIVFVLGVTAAGRRRMRRRCATLQAERGSRGLLQGMRRIGPLDAVAQRKRARSNAQILKSAQGSS